MAVAWIKTDQSLKDHRKLLDAAYRLQIAPPHMMGLLISLWLWCLDNAPDGDLSGVSTWVISKAAQWDGVADDFVEILIETGWIDDKNGLFVHDWDDYAGILMRKRADAKARTREWRAKGKAAKERAKPDSVIEQKEQENTPDNVCVTYVSQTDTLRPKSRVEKSRVEKSRNTPHKSPQGDSAEPEKSDSTPEPPVISILLSDGSEWPVGEQQVSEWSALFPGVDVMQQLRHMRAWSEANPSKRNTARGVKRFITAWLTREQDRGGERKQTGERYETYGMTTGWEGLEAL